MNFVISIASSQPSTPCNFKKIGDGVCICDVNYCDTLDTEEPTCDTFTMVTTSKFGKRFATTSNLFNSFGIPNPLPTKYLRIDQDRVYQSLIGFGGALTDASSIVIEEMNESIRQCFYKSYMSPKYGAAYKLFRIPIGGSDFSVKPWAYNETPVDDIDLSNMTEFLSIDRIRIEQINEMRKYQNDIKIMLCTWSPPIWMKSNKAWSGASYLLRKYYKTWALYHIKAMNLWKNANMSIWSISTGNEPTNSIVVPFMSLGWLASEQKLWITDYLKPMLMDAGFFDTLILGLDDQRTNIPIFTSGYQKSFIDTNIVVDLIGVHWYFDTLSLDNILDRAAQRYNKPILYTESCTGAGLNILDPIHGPIIGSWKRLQEYVHKMMNCFLHCTSAFIDWNMVLNKMGGPNYAGNYVDAPMIFIKENQTLYKQPMFYGIAHFSTFLQSNCVRIDSKLSFLSSIYIEVVAFACDYEKIVIILNNQSPNSESIIVIDEKKGHINLTLDSNSVNTLIYKICQK